MESKRCAGLTSWVHLDEKIEETGAALLSVSRRAGEEQKAYCVHELGVRAGATTDSGQGLPPLTWGGPTDEQDRWQYALACGCRVSLHHHQPTQVAACNNSVCWCCTVFSCDAGGVQGPNMGLGVTGGQNLQSQGLPLPELWLTVAFTG